MTFIKFNTTTHEINLKTQENTGEHWRTQENTGELRTLPPQQSEAGVPTTTEANDSFTTELTDSTGWTLGGH